MLYLVTAFAFMMLGGVEALLMRTQLAEPGNTLLTPERYNQVLTMHGTTMVFLVVMPLWAGFANYFVPLQVGARDMAFPRLNALSYWLYLAGGIVFYASVFFSPPEAGWTAYTPLSSGPYIPGNGTDAWIFLIHLTGLSSILGRAEHHRDDRQHARPRHGLGPPAAVLLVDARPGDHDPAHAAGHRRRRDAAAHRPPLRHLLLRLRTAAARRCCGSTCSGSSATPRSTS